jgi:hypothetical protein
MFQIQLFEKGLCLSLLNIYTCTDINIRAKSFWCDLHQAAMR